MMCDIAADSVFAPATTALSHISGCLAQTQMTFLLQTVSRASPQRAQAVSPSEPSPSHRHVLGRRANHVIINSQYGRKFMNFLKL